MEIVGEVFHWSGDSFPLIRFSSSFVFFSSARLLPSFDLRRRCVLSIYIHVAEQNREADNGERLGVIEAVGPQRAGL